MFFKSARWLLRDGNIKIVRPVTCCNDRKMPIARNASSAKQSIARQELETLDAPNDQAIFFPRTINSWAWFECVAVVDGKTCLQPRGACDLRDCKIHTLANGGNF